MTLKERAPRYEPVRVDIRTVAEAKQIIIDRARSVVLGVHWAKYGIRDHAKVAATFDVFFGVVLRNAPYQIPVTLLDMVAPQDRDVYRRLPRTHVMPLPPGNSQFYLALLKQKLTPSEAAFVRDYLIVKMPEAIVGIGLGIHDLRNAQVQRVLLGVYKSNQFIREATQNVSRGLRK